MGQKVPKNISEEIQAYWRTGNYSQRDLAYKYSVSPAYINKICKHLEQDMNAVVNAGLSYLQGIEGIDEKVVNVVNEEVTQKARLIGLVATFNERAITKALSLIEKIDSGQELKNVVDAVDRVTITAKINERHGSVSSTVINNSAQAAAAAVNRPQNIIFKGR